MGYFLELPTCSRPVILKIDFFREYGGVVDLRDLLVTFADPHFPEIMTPFKLWTQPYTVLMSQLHCHLGAASLSG